MDAGVKLKKDNPKDNCNILSQLFFGWIARPCLASVKNNFTISDLYKISNSNKAKKLTDTLEIKWAEELKTQNPSLFRAIFKIVLGDFMFTGFLLFVGHVVVRSLEAVILAYFIDLVSKTGGHNDYKLFMWAIFLVFLTFLNVALHLHCEYLNTIIGMRIRIAITSLVYRKLLRLNLSNLVESENLVDFITNQVSRMDLVFVRLHILWIMPFQILFTIGLTWNQVGIATLAGVMPALFVIMPMQTLIDRIISKMQKNLSLLTSLRVNVTNEIICGIKAIKVLAWEKYFTEMISKIRKNEIRALTKLLYLKGFVASSHLWTERLISFLTIAVYVYINHEITADQLFFVVLLYEFLSASVSVWYPTAINYLLETLPVIERVREFLMLQEKLSQDAYNVSYRKDIVLKNVTATCNFNNLTLKNINLHVPKGALCVIVGAKNSGKSSILNLLLGELTLTSGSIEIGAFVSYSAQNPWIFSSSIRNNIIFGQRYDEAKFSHIVKICNLSRDFQKFAEGDETYLGQGGVILNAEQKARINLARAVYRAADVYLLDEPLAGVGSRVGKEIFEDCVAKYLKNKTRVVVTGRMEYVRKADHLVVINSGVIEAQGRFEDIKEHVLKVVRLRDADAEGEEEERWRSDVYQDYRRDSVITQKPSTAHIFKHSPFKKYTKSSYNTISIFLLLAILILSQCIFSATSFWPTVWSRRAIEIIRLLFVTDKSQDAYITINGTATSSVDEKDRWMHIYLGFTLTTIALILLRSMIFFKFAMKASTKIHNEAFIAILHAPLNFFNRNPRGKIQNDISKSIGIIDEALPNAIHYSFQLILESLGNIIMILIGSYYMISFMAMLGIILTIVSCWYVYVITKLNCLEEEANTPILAYLRWSLSGITTIRASKKESLLREEFENHQNTHTSSWLLVLEANLFFAMLIKLLGVFLVSIVSFTCVFLKVYTNFDSSDIGLTISQALILIEVLQSGASQIGEVVNNLKSVDKIQEYTELDLEKQSQIENGIFKSITWPNNGLIEFKNVSLHYPGSDCNVLTDLNFVIPAGTKIGIVGKIGAGKTSLVSAILRLVKYEGTIFIDNIDVSSVSLEDLRRNISVISKDPVLFTSSLRFNLDPSKSCKDEKLWKALADVEIKDCFKDLSYIINPSSKDLTLGQKQLLCLARAVIRDSKILILDEATENVDLYTENLMSRVIRNRFPKHTVITITQSLQGIIDSDLVLVLDSGKIVEFGHPNALLQNNDGYFAKMVGEAGPKMRQRLYNISRESL